MAWCEDTPRCVDARETHVGSYTASLRKMKSDNAKAKWLSSSNKRYFTIDFDTRLFFYSHTKDRKRISAPVPFKDILGADRLPPPPAKGLRRRSSTADVAFLVRTRQRVFELHGSSGADAEAWVNALNAARDLAKETEPSSAAACVVDEGKKHQLLLDHSSAVEDASANVSESLPDTDLADQGVDASRGAANMAAPSCSHHAGAAPSVQEFVGHPCAACDVHPEDASSGRLASQDDDKTALEGSKCGAQASANDAAHLPSVHSLPTEVAAEERASVVEKEQSAVTVNSTVEAMPLDEKVKRLWIWADADKDGILNRTEVERLVLATDGSKPNYQDYSEMCKMLGGDPSVGLSREQWSSMYSKDMANIDEDFKKVFADASSSSGLNEGKLRPDALSDGIACPPPEPIDSPPKSFQADNPTALDSSKKLSVSESVSQQEVVDKRASGPAEPQQLAPTSRPLELESASPSAELKPSNRPTGPTGPPPGAVLRQSGPVGPPPGPRGPVGPPPGPLGSSPTASKPASGPTGPPPGPRPAGPTGPPPGPLRSSPGPSGPPPGPVGPPPAPRQSGPVGPPPGPLGSPPGPTGSPPGPVGPPPGPCQSGPMGPPPGPRGSPQGLTGAQPAAGKVARALAPAPTQNPAGERSAPLTKAEKIDKIWKWADEDGDGMLNRAEVTRLVQATENDALSDDDYVELCQMLGGDPAAGLTFAQWKSAYDKEMSDINEDFEKLFADTETKGQASVGPSPQHRGPVQPPPGPLGSPAASDGLLPPPVGAPPPSVNEPPPVPSVPELTPPRPGNAQSSSQHPVTAPSGLPVQTRGPVGPPPPASKISPPTGAPKGPCGPPPGPTPKGPCGPPPGPTPKGPGGPPPGPTPKGPCGPPPGPIGPPPGPADTSAGASPMVPNNARVVSAVVPLRRTIPEPSSQTVNDPEVSEADQHSAERSSCAEEQTSQNVLDAVGLDEPPMKEPSTSSSMGLASQSNQVLAGPPRGKKLAPLSFEIDAGTGPCKPVPARLAERLSKPRSSKKSKRKSEDVLDGSNRIPDGDEGKPKQHTELPDAEPSGWDSDKDETKAPPNHDACGAPLRGQKTSFVAAKTHRDVSSRKQSGKSDENDLTSLVSEMLHVDDTGCVPVFHCTSCDHQVLRTDNFVWSANVDYMFLRNNYPDIGKLRAQLEPKNGCCAFCCQCSSRSADITADLDDVAEGLRWKLIQN
eukprot:TRINITY_DN3179_c0_g1_i7.p1 TRINITY_DN3179_c0_g1~~TRINITY_DN3179_c0_g1_i7.p1  ORF type:complete len:1207 (-),score=134.29 TRINITY_DN3179_c0_g1_i7:719-4339(-)